MLPYEMKANNKIIITNERHTIINTSTKTVIRSILTAVLVGDKNGNFSITPGKTEVRKSPN